MANAKETANSFASGVSSELDFINQCRKFAEAGDDTYADDAASLVTETKKSNIEEALLLQTEKRATLQLLKMMIIHVSILYIT